MFGWLRAERKSAELPEYSALRALATRRLPSELIETEAGEAFVARQTALSEELSASPLRPEDDKPLLTALSNAERTGFLTMTFPEGNQRCVPVFSAPWRVADYRRVLLSHDPSWSDCLLTPAGCVRLLQDLRVIGGIETFALDRCPRCSIFTWFGSTQMKTPGDVITIWAIQKASELLRTELYLAYALGLARRGCLEAARDVALETVGHVTMENPQTHFLLGQLAVGLRDQTLLREAKTFLRVFGFEQWGTKLDRVVKSGSPDYTGPAQG
jgi:hypothetical protein